MNMFNKTMTKTCFKDTFEKMPLKSSLKLEKQSLSLYMK